MSQTMYIQFSKEKEKSYNNSAASHVKNDMSILGENNYLMSPKIKSTKRKTSAARYDSLIKILLQIHTYTHAQAARQARAARYFSRQTIINFIRCALYRGARI